MEKLVQEYLSLLQEDKMASKKFWELEDRIFKDKRSVGVAIDMRRSRMITNILSLLDDGVIQMEDLKEFSDELQECINFFIYGR
ncbi:MAG: multidrug transporter [Faecalicoccus sp.]|uniref:multidrug transporter n=1 Tax=Faecalicoccus sp. TaxID=1971758 RepID=UPI002F94E975